MNSVCVFSGSYLGKRPEYAEAAGQLGRTLAQRGLTLVYGGARIGLMGQLADAALEAGGKVVGVMLEDFVERGIHHQGLSELRVAATMHQRKQEMFALADAFVALPGGIGTLEEFFEAQTWAQLKFHRKPCGLLDVCGYYRKLLDFLEHAVAERFLKPEYYAMLHVAETPEALLDKLAHYRAPRSEST